MQQFMASYSLLQFILLKMTIKIPLKREINTKESLCYDRRFSQFWTYFDDRPKYYLTVPFLQIFFAYELSYENKSQSSTE